MKTQRFITDSPERRLVAALAITAVWLFAPEITQAAVAFGEMGRNVADNAKGVAKGVTMGGFAAGVSMGVWGCVDMYDASYDLSNLNLSIIN